MTGCYAEYGEETQYSLQVNISSCCPMGFVYGKLEPAGAEAIITTTGGTGTLSLPDGRYFLPHGPGSFTLTANAECYETFQQDILVSDNEETSLDIMLTPIPGCNSSPKDNYIFERMIPVLQSPWYFIPSDLATDKKGNVYIADQGGGLIQKFGPSGEFITKWKVTGGQFNAITVDKNGYVYHVVNDQDFIRKFSSEGEPVLIFGKTGSYEGEFSDPKGIATDINGNIYVSDTGNNRIQKFNSYGKFISEWGTKGTEEGEFDEPLGIETDGTSYVYVADSKNYRIQKFGLEGEFVSKWGDNEFNFDDIPQDVATDKPGNIYMTENGSVWKFDQNGKFIRSKRIWPGEYNQIGYHVEIATDKNGYIYVADNDNHRIRKFTTELETVALWQAWGDIYQDGWFRSPTGIVRDAYNNIYVVDSGNKRIQKFDKNGEFVQEKWKMPETTDFYEPYGIASDNISGYIYVSDVGRHVIRKFRLDGTFVADLGTEGKEDGKFINPKGIAVDGQGNIYIADNGNDRIQKFSSSGEFIIKWGSSGSDDGYFSSPTGIAADSGGNIYVADNGNNRVQVFSPSGDFMTKWGTWGFENENFANPVGIALDEKNNVYVTDMHGHFIRKFTSHGEFITKFGGFGSDPGMLAEPTGLCAINNKVYAADTRNHRIQVFANKEDSGEPPVSASKAVIIAGGGPSPGNNLWTVTQMCASHAHRTLEYQGYTKDTIEFLSADTNLDIVDKYTTIANLESAITEWAKDAKDIVIYMVDHGGEGTFRMNASEILQASEFDTWIDTIQEIIPGYVIIIYDACRSGSFLSQLIPLSGRQRIVITSTDTDKNALFAGQGTLSFSYLFWSCMLNGDSLYDSFAYARKTTELIYPQIPQLDANGNGIGNERSDQDITMTVSVGNEIKTGDDIPYIDAVSPAQTLEHETSALIYAEGIYDADGISRVWAVITPPGYSTNSPEIPVTDLPVIDLNFADNNRYEAVYDNFTSAGTYNIAIFATDKNGMYSLPKQTTVKVSNNAPAWMTITGRVLNENGMPLCAMVLANGQHTFSCDEDGRYELDAPPDENGEITLFAFCDGFMPFRRTLTSDETSDFDINMSPAPANNPDLTLTVQTETLIANSEWVKVRGAVFDENETPVCAMILANGQHIFSCDTVGEFELEVPLDNNGEITLFAFCDGFQPYKDILKP